jgi:hypothetical protein
MNQDIIVITGCTVVVYWLRRNAVNSIGQAINSGVGPELV